MGLRGEENVPLLELGTQERVSALRESQLIHLALCTYPRVCDASLNKNPPGQWIGPLGLRDCAFSRLG